MPKSFYVVTPDADVYRTATNSRAELLATELNGWTASDTELKNIPTTMLVALHNRIRPERPIKKFVDRATAEVRLKGVLDTLAIKDPAKSEDIPADPIGAKKSRKAPKPPAGKVVVERKVTVVKEIPEDHVTRAIAMRKEKKSWLEVCTALGKELSYCLKLRPLMKAKDPNVVMKIGPGSDGYGKGPTKKPTTRAAKRAASTIPKEDF